MASSQFHVVFILCVCSFYIHQAVSGSGPYRSIFSFGDSLADTGNFLISGPFGYPFVDRLPYGQTYFGHPTGRFSDGRLIVDFIAEAYGLPKLPPYLASLHHHRADFRQGVNFAVAGATALDPVFFQERDIATVMWTNNSLSVQMGWFEQFKSSLCHTTQECADYFAKSLFLVGEIGGNDYNYAFLQGLSIEHVRTFVPKVVQAIAAATNLDRARGSGAGGTWKSADWMLSWLSDSIFQLEKEDYNPRNGCLKALNGLSKYHNTFLQAALENQRQKYPHVKIIYADYYGASMRFFNYPQNFGFTNLHSACCGGGGPSNFNGSALCGATGSTVCIDPSTFASWDGIHLTEAAYRTIANGMIEGFYTTPPMTFPHQEINHRL